MHRKTILFSLLTFACLLVLSVILLPWFVSTHAGKEMLLSVLNNRLPAAVNIETLSLSWSGPQKIEGFSFQERSDRIKFYAPKISTDASLLSLLVSSPDVGMVVIESPDVQIHQNIPSTPLPPRPEVQAASFIAAAPLNSYLPKLSLPFMGNIEIHQGKISVFSDKTSPTIFNLATCKLVANKELSEVTCHVEGSTKQNEIEGSVLVDVVFKRSNSLERSLESNIVLTNFPVDGADEILSLQVPSYRHLLIDAIGPSLNLKCTLSSSKESCMASLDLESKQLQGKALMQLLDEKLTLTAPASLQIDLSPKLLKRLQLMVPAIKDLPLIDSLYSLIDIKKLSIPKVATGLIFKEASFQGNVSIKPYSIGNLTLGCSGAFASSNLSEEAAASLDVQMQSGSVSTSSKARLTCRQMFASVPDLTASLDIGNTPTSFLETMFPLPLTALLGASLEGSLFAKSAQDEINITCKFVSSLLQLQNAAFAWKDNTLSLLKPFEVSFIATQGLVTSLVSSNDLALQKDVPITATVSQVKTKDLSSLKDLVLDMTLSVPSIQLSSFFSLKAYPIEQLNLSLKTNSLSKVAIDLTSNRLSLRGEGGIDLQSRSVFWQKPMLAQYILTNQEMQALKGPLLARNVPLQIQIDPASFSLNAPSWNQVKLTAHISAKELLVKSSQVAEALSLQNLKGTIEFLAAKDACDVSLSSDVASGKLSCQASITQLRSQDPSFKMTLSCEKFPTALIDTLTSKQLTKVIGHSIDLKLVVDKESTFQSLWIDGKTPNLKVLGGATFDPSKGLFLSNNSNPIQIEFLLTPQSYQLLSHASPFMLAKDALFKGSLTTLSAPFLASKPTRLDFSHLLVNIRVENDLISFLQTGRSDLLTLTQTSLVLQKKEHDTPLSLSLDSLAEAGQKGSLHIDAQIKKLLDEQGYFELSHVESDLIVSFQKFPSAALEVLFPAKKGQLSGLLGSMFDMTIKAALQNASGPFAVDLNSPNTKLAIEGILTNGVLTLRQNAMAELALTPETSHVFLAGVNPLSISSLSAPRPVTLEIVAKGFSLPLSPFALNQIQMPKARIIPGKVFCRNEGNINMMLGLLKSKQQGKELELWFAPIDLSIQQGVLDLERTEVLVAGTYDIALWGRLDLPSNRVNMILGLTAPCLSAAFNIRDLPKDYVLHIPLSGTLDHVELNKSVATSKIVALTLWQSKSVAGSAIGGPGGALVGGLLNQVLAPPGNDEPTPKAKTPYPWQKGH